MNEDYIQQSVDHVCEFLDEAIPAVRREMGDEAAEHPGGFLQHAYTLSVTIRDREDLADIAALAIRRLAAQG
ncbi:hypothetical protein [Mycobacterium phage WXIN]|nr:hypothetical protein [Mycobacterium phage WXIN]